MEWKKNCRQRAPLETPIVKEAEQHQHRPFGRVSVTQASEPQPFYSAIPMMHDFRRQAKYLHTLAESKELQDVLCMEPYSLPWTLIQQLATIQDLATLVRRTTAGIQTPPLMTLEPFVAMDVILLASRLCAWYSGI